MSLHSDLERLAARAKEVELSVSHYNRTMRALEAALTAHPEIRNVVADTLAAEGYDVSKIRTLDTTPTDALEA